VASIHLIRAFAGWQMTIQELNIPVFVSFISFVLLGFISFSGFSLWKRIE